MCCAGLTTTQVEKRWGGLVGRLTLWCLLWLLLWKCGDIVVGGGSDAAGSVNIRLSSQCASGAVLNSHAALQEKKEFHLREAIRLYPPYISAYVNLGGWLC